MRALTGRPSWVGTLVIDRPWRTDLTAAVLAVAAFLGWALTREGAELREALPATARSDLYISLTATSGALLGFVLTALAILIALPSGERLGFLRKSRAWPKFPGVFLRSAWVLGGATLIFTAGTLLDTDERPSVVIESAAVAGFVLVVLRVVATVLLLGRVVEYAFRDASTNEREDL